MAPPYGFADPSPDRKFRMPPMCNWPARLKPRNCPLRNMIRRKAAAIRQYRLFVGVILDARCGKGE